MPRKLDGSSTLDTLEDEVMFTIASLQADPDAAELLSATSDWMAKIDSVRAIDREVRQAVATTDAKRVNANIRLDIAVLSFADELLMDVDKNRQDPRWQEFFKETPSRFVNRPLQEEVTTVQGWVSASSDPVLENNRSSLSAYANEAQTALVSTASLSSRRSSLKQARAALAEGLTADRDALHRQLAERARASELPRTWPDSFFRTE